MRGARLGMVFILAGATAIGAMRPARAQMCATLTIIQNGVPQTTSHCEPFLDQFPAACQGGGHQVAGDGFDVTLCAPNPPAQLQ